MFHSPYQPSYRPSFQSSWNSGSGGVTLFVLVFDDTGTITALTESVDIVHPDAMVVEGTLQVDGVYLRDGDLNSKPKYANGTHRIEWYSNLSTHQWNILFVSGEDEVVYYSNEDVDTPDLVTTWSIVAPSPVPTVRRATWADIVSFGIDPSTVPLLAPVSDEAVLTL